MAVPSLTNLKKWFIIDVVIHKNTTSKQTRQIAKRDMPLRDYQAHLERIGDFLVCGIGVWWHGENGKFVFHDGEKDDDFKREGPEMTNFKTHNFQLVANEVQACWKRCITEDIDLPITKINIYNRDGDFENCKVIHNDELTLLNTDDNIQTEEDENTVIDISMEQQPGFLNMADEKNDFDSKGHHMEKKVDKQVMQVEQEIPLESEIARKLKFVIGYCDKLKEFDYHHSVCKDTKREYSRKKCKVLITHFRKLVLDAESEAETFIKQWEKEFVIKNSRVPNIKDLKTNDNYMKKYKVAYVGKKILCQWKDT
ncbi:uncharacterized protein LOC130630131 [Hydractinia symbiolongicarpus]|uniref:uncharacterized protein LOC130630131 n=1 Tax=Hydractinia symbiolongicarpus TaxID=13093 RepID=UPI00254CE5C8|nr:uncharacterized protein LOC130630131 [Hydractinia symbiolongicarpus]